MSNDTYKEWRRLEKDRWRHPVLGEVARETTYWIARPQDDPEDVLGPFPSIKEAQSSLRAVWHIVQGWGWRRTHD